MNSIPAEGDANGSSEDDNAEMSLAEREKQLCDVLRMEAQCAHERLGAFTDSTQKFVGVMLSLTTAAIGYLFFRVGTSSFEKLFSQPQLPYELLFLSLITSIALAQATHYNTLAFFYIERKREVGQKLADLIHSSRNPLDGAEVMRDSAFWGPFKVSSYIYFVSEALIGTVFAGIALVIGWHQRLLTSLWFMPAAVLITGLALATGFSTGKFLRTADEFFLTGIGRGKLYLKRRQSSSGNNDKAQRGTQI